MANQSASRLHGDDYQHLYSWLKILDLLNSETEIDYIWVEHPFAGAADDITIHPKDPETHVTKFYQVKGHRDLSKTYSMEELITPIKKGSKTLLRSLWDSWRELWQERRGDIEIWLVSDWLADEFLGKYIRSEQLNEEFFQNILKYRTDVAKKCKKWRKHLDADNDQDFEIFCRSLHFDLGRRLPHLRELIAAEMRSYDLKSEDEYINNGVALVRQWIQQGEQKTKITTFKLLKEIERRDLWASSYVDSSYHILRIEQEFAEKTREALGYIRTEIPKIGSITRQENVDIENKLQQGIPVVLVGDAGTGKSGIAATLAQTAIDHGKIVLLLDARWISHVQDESDLQRYFNLECPFRIAIEQAGAYKGCRFIVDQLDNVVGSRAAELLANLALNNYKMSGVEVIVISRGSKKIHEAKPLEKLVSEGFHEEASSSLNETEARRNLNRLGIMEPSLDLVKLGTSLLNLEVISLLKQEQQDVDFPASISDVDLWEKYLGIIWERESIGQGYDFADTIVAEAKKIARDELMTPDGHRGIVLKEPVPQSIKRLVGAILIPVSGKKYYGFRHEELQYFLYALDATEDNKGYNDILDEIDHRARGVLPWMLKLYRRHSEESEQDAELYRQFLRESLNVR